MALDSEFLSMMPDTVTVYAKSSLDNYGKRTWSASGTSYSARIEPAIELARTEDGREVTVIATIYLYGSPTLTTDHKIVMPDSSVPVIVSVTVHNDETGAHNTVVKVGR